MSLFNFHKRAMPDLVLRPHDPVGSRRWRVLLVAAWLLSLVAAWMLASYRAAPELLSIQAEVRKARSDLAKLSEELELSERARSISEKSDQVSRTANESLQATLRTQEEELAELRSDIAFFQRLMDGKSGRKGLSVQNPAIRAIPGGRGYNLRATLTQNLRKGEVTKGTIAISVEGMQGDRMVVLAWDSLSGRQPGASPQFSFKYFQQFESSFILPQGFSPNRIRLVLKSEQGDNVEQNFAWSQALSHGENDDVWQ